MASTGTRAGIAIAVASTLGVCAPAWGLPTLHDAAPALMARYQDSGRVVSGGALVKEAARSARLLQATGENPVLAYELRPGTDAAVWMFVAANEILVTLASREQVEAARARILAAPHALSIVDEVPNGRTLLIRAATNGVLAPEEVRAAFVAVTGIEPAIAEPNQLLTAHDAQDRQYERLLQPWPHRNRGENGAKVDADIDGNEALSRLIYATNTAPVVRNPLIMVIDTGVDIGHPALKDGIWTNTDEIPGNGVDDDKNGYRDDVNGWNFVGNNNLLFDPDGHGTHVAGIIIGKPSTGSGAIRGTAIGSRIMVGKVDVTLPTGLIQVVKAMRYAIDKRASIVNMSLSFPASSPTFDEALKDFEAIEGITVASAGNVKPGETQLDLRLKPLFPCMSPYAICVAASDEQDKLAPFSNYGARFSVLGQPGVALAAPGTNILSAAPGGGYVVKHGTSMAAPMVSAAFAAAWRAKPLANRNEIRSQVVFSSDKVDGITIEQAEDGRRLNLYRALFGRPDADYAIGYCDERITDPQTGQIYSRSQQFPFANSGEPGVDGASIAGAFTICTTAQMANIQGEMLDRIFVMKRDLNWRSEPTGNWTGSIGMVDNVVSPFNGVLDGGGYAITGFDQGLKANAGLIARLGPRGHVLNMRFRDVRLKGVQTAAVVAARNDGGRIFNVQAEGRVEAPVAGGLVAGMYGGDIRMSAFEGMVTGSVTTGGVVAQMVGETSFLADSLFSGQVTGAFQVGGLVGNLGYRAVIARSHANVDMPLVSGMRKMAGGLVGNMQCRARIEDSFAQGTMQATEMAGGLVGRLTNADISRAYASVFISTDNATTGGAVGEIKDAIIGDTGNYLCSESQVKPPPSKRVDDFYDSLIGRTGPGTPRTETQLRDPANYRTWSADVWALSAGQLPPLKRLPRSTHPDY